MGMGWGMGDGVDDELMMGMVYVDQMAIARLPIGRNIENDMVFRRHNNFNIDNWFCGLS